MVPHPPSPPVTATTHLAGEGGSSLFPHRAVFWAMGHSLSVPYSPAGQDRPHRGHLGLEGTLGIILWIGRCFILGYWWGGGGGGAWLCFSPVREGGSLLVTQTRLPCRSTAYEREQSQNLFHFRPQILSQVLWPTPGSSWPKENEYYGAMSWTLLGHLGSQQDCLRVWFSLISCWLPSSGQTLEGWCVRWEKWQWPLPLPFMTTLPQPPIRRSPDFSLEVVVTVLLTGLARILTKLVFSQVAKGP